MRKLIFSLFLLALSTPIVSAQQFDVVLAGGRVMDPESGLDAVRNVGIRGGRIARISAEPLTGTRTLHARGLVVAPGFIDLHQHAQDDAERAAEGLRRRHHGLEMEIGAPDVARFLRRRKAISLITTARPRAIRPRGHWPSVRRSTIRCSSPPGPATNEAASPANLAPMRGAPARRNRRGRLGIGMGIQYTPGATRLEVIRMFRVAAERRVPVFTHVRSAGRVEPGSSIEAVSEVIGAAAITGASLQIVHINSSCLPTRSSASPWSPARARAASTSRRRPIRTSPE